MRVKTLLLGVSVACAFISNSNAQIFSQNAVGYVNISVPANGYRILGNPLNGPAGNSLNDILALPAGYDGASVYRFNCAIQSYRDTMQWATGIGWLASDPADLIINPGEGFFVQNVAPVVLPIVFIGEVPSGNLNLQVPGGGKYCMLASQIPKPGHLGFTGDPATHQFPTCTGDSIFIFDPVCQCYRDTYQYVDGIGWLHNVDPDPRGPLIGVAEGFFVQKVCSSAVWSQSFSVGP